jgi:hypothetical protein
MKIENFKPKSNDLGSMLMVSLFGASYSTSSLTRPVQWALAAPACALVEATPPALAGSAGFFTGHEVNKLARLNRWPHDANGEGNRHHALVVHQVGQGLKKPRIHFRVAGVAHRRNLPPVLLLLSCLPGDGSFRSFKVASCREGEGSRFTQGWGGCEWCVINGAAYFSSVMRRRLLCCIYSDGRVGDT